MTRPRRVYPTAASQLIGIIARMGSGERSSALLHRGMVSTRYHLGPDRGRTAACLVTKNFNPGYAVAGAVLLQ